MLANKSKLYIRFARFSFGLLLLSSSIFPVYSMQKMIDSSLEAFSPGMCRFLNGFFTKNSLEIVWPALQDKIYGREDDNTQVSHHIVELIHEVIAQMDEFPKNHDVVIKKMNKNYTPYVVAQEYCFLGIAPTNKTLYVDEDYFKKTLSRNILEAQKLIIRTALKHYANGTYFKRRGVHVITASVSAALTGYTYQYGFSAVCNLAKSARSYCFSEPEINMAPVINSSWYNPIPVIKSLGTKTALLVVGLFVCHKIYSKIYEALDMPFKKYLEKRTSTFTKESSQTALNDLEKQELVKGMLWIFYNAKKNNGSHAVLMNQGITGIFSADLISQMQQEFAENTKKYKEEFYSLKKQNNTKLINEFVTSIDIKLQNEYFNGPELKNYIIGLVMNDLHAKFTSIEQKNDIHQARMLLIEVSMADQQYKMLGITPMVHTLLRQIIELQNALVLKKQQ